MSSHTGLLIVHDTGAAALCKESTTSQPRGGTGQASWSICCATLGCAPNAGHYARGATVLENLSMAEPLLSRFDLVFILLDASDEQKDKHLSEHVMALHSGANWQHPSTQ
jgi:DNA replicative helicase MCM subunit Mcm2 (Cdc46/Mcm family)